MLEFDADKAAAEVRQAATADLLDRITAYRRGMEPAAIALIEEELRQRGVDQTAIAAHADECRRACVVDASGTALACSRCRRPAVKVVRGWHRLWGVLPLFPRSVPLCREHLEGPLAGSR